MVAGHEGRNLSEWTYLLAVAVSHFGNCTDKTCDRKCGAQADGSRKDGVHTCRCVKARLHDVAFIVAVFLTAKARLVECAFAIPIVRPSRVGAFPDRGPDY